MDKQALQLVRKYTNRGLNQCLATLREYEGDALGAIKALLTPQEVSELRNNVISRLIVPNTLDGPPSPEEARILLHIQETGQQVSPGDQ